MTEEIPLPREIAALVEARNALRECYSDTGLRFTLDGNLVGDLGEALAAQIFGLELTGRGREGIDGVAPDGRTVQVKASGTRRGPVFRQTQMTAEHLVFFHFDYERCTAETIYNGPEEAIRSLLPSSWTGQRMVSISKVRELGRLVPPGSRLRRVLA